MTRYFVAFDNGTYTDQPGATTAAPWNQLSYTGPAADSGTIKGWHSASWQDISSSIDPANATIGGVNGAFIPWDNAFQIRETTGSIGAISPFVRYPYRPAFLASQSDAFGSTGVLNNANSQVPTSPFSSDTVSYSLIKAANLSVSMSFMLIHSCSFSGAATGSDANATLATVEMDSTYRYIMWDNAPARISNINITNSNFNAGGNNRQIHIAYSYTNADDAYYALYIHGYMAPVGTPTTFGWQSIPLNGTSSLSAGKITGSWTTNTSNPPIYVRIQVVRLRDSRDADYTSGPATSYRGVPVWWIDTATSN